MNKDPLLTVVEEKIVSEEDEGDQEESMGVGSLSNFLLPINKNGQTELLNLTDTQLSALYLKFCLPTNPNKLKITPSVDILTKIEIKSNTPNPSSTTMTITTPRSAPMNEKDYLLLEKEGVYHSHRDMQGGSANSSMSEGGVKTKVIVIGDIHGDYGALISSLNVAGLIEPSGKLCSCIEGQHDAKCEKGEKQIQIQHQLIQKPDSGGDSSSLDINKNPFINEVNRWIWKGGNSYLILLGDMVDRDKDRRDEYDHTTGEFMYEAETIQRVLNELRSQAKKHKGKIIKVIGNHEMINWQGDERYSTRLVYKTNLIDLQKLKWGIEGIMTNLLKGDAAPGDSSHLHCIVKVGEWLFVNGGLLNTTVGNYLEQAEAPGEDDATRSSNFVTKINGDFHLWLKGEEDPPREFISGPKTEAIVNKSEGHRRPNLPTLSHTTVLWNKDMGQGDQTKLKQLDNNFKDLKKLLGNIKIAVCGVDQTDTFAFPRTAYVPNNKGESILCGPWENWQNVRVGSWLDVHNSVGEVIGDVEVQSITEDGMATLRARGETSGTTGGTPDLTVLLRGKVQVRWEPKTPKTIFTRKFELKRSPANPYMRPPMLGKLKGITKAKSGVSPPDKPMPWLGSARSIIENNGCSLGINHLVADSGRDYPSSKVRSTDGNIWRLDIGMSRAYDSGRDIRLYNNEDTAPVEIEELDRSEVLKLRAKLLARRPQILEITLNSEGKTEEIKVKKATKSLPRDPGHCPYPDKYFDNRGGCKCCAAFKGVNFDEIIKNPNPNPNLNPGFDIISLNGSTPTKDQLAKWKKERNRTQVKAQKGLNRAERIESRRKFRQFLRRKNLVNYVAPLVRPDGIER